MAKRIKYTEKELKGPDKFVSTVVSGFEYFADHSKKIVIGVGIVIVLIIIGYIIAGMSGKKGDIAGQKFSAAVAQYNSGSSEEALSEFAAIRDEYPNTPVASLAAYYAGLIQYENGNYDEAVAMLDTYTNSKNTERLLVQAAVLKKGIARYRQGRWQEAIDYFEIINNDPSSPYGSQSKLQTALSYEKMGQPEKAREIYQNLYGTGFVPQPGISAVNTNPAPTE
ncbi:MAG: tetratricopeptide repeat protein [Thermodesulfobacteriota bacterium]